MLLFPATIIHIHKKTPSDFVYGTQWAWWADLTKLFLIFKISRIVFEVPEKKDQSPFRRPIAGFDKIDLLFELYLRVYTPASASMWIIRLEG